MVKLSSNSFRFFRQFRHRVLRMLHPATAVNVQHLNYSQSVAPGEIKLGASSCTSGVRRRDLMSEITSSRRRCKTLESLQDEYLIVAYIEVYLSQGLVQHAEALFNKYRRQGHQFHSDVCTKMLMGFAEQGNNLKSSILYRNLMQEGIRPSPSLYAALLHLCSKTHDAKYALEIVREMKQNGISINDIFYKTNLNEKQATSIKMILTVCFGQSVEEELKPLSEPEPVYPRVIQSLYSSSNENYCLSHKKTAITELLGDADLQERFQEQLQVEKEGVLNVQSIQKGSDDTVSEINLNDAISDWRRTLTVAMETEIEEYSRILDIIESDLISSRFIPKHYPTLPIMSAEDWANILVEDLALEIIEQPDGLPVKYLCGRIKKRTWAKFVKNQKYADGIVQKILNFNPKKDLSLLIHMNNITDMYEQYTSFLTSPDYTSKSARQYWNELCGESVLKGSMKLNITHWPFFMGFYIGGILLDILLKGATIAEMGSNRVQAFYHYYQFENNKKIGFIKAHPLLHKYWRSMPGDKLPSFKMEADIVPMVVPPRPWVSVTDGGYLLTPVSIVRCQEDTFQHQLMMEQAENLHAIYDALDYVSSIPWMVNSKILELVLTVFNENGNEDLMIPKGTMPPLPEIPKNAAPEEKTQILRQRKEMRKAKHEMHALRMDMLYKLSLAKHFEDRVFWLPHNMDFRGRSYPLPPHITHLSSDVGRALLQFAEGYPLGKRGLQWLKIHLVNLHGGKKKAPMREREEYVEELLPLILDSADKPFDGQRWWQLADSPWQTLACCIDLASAIRSGDPEGYVSHIPIHQDGSCNGLQHYAALGRDKLGGFQVNLTPSEKPEDLYTAVAMMVDERRKQDAAEGNVHAQVLEGKVIRKVVKQTVMTTVYGVTLYGGRLQIQKQLEDNIPKEHLFHCSKYLVQLVFQTLSHMFSNARDIQEWLIGCSRQISMAGHPTEWVTPLGMPVVQPYHRKSKLKAGTTPLQQTSIQSSTDLSRPPDLTKQKNAFPPNFIHSLDSTHMMLTALHCQRVGITFVSVHDCYWTHACMVDKMNKICREQFVALHKEPILEDLAEYLDKMFGGLEYVDRLSKKKEQKQCNFNTGMPNKGDLDLDQVLESTYFFS